MSTSPSTLSFDAGSALVSPHILAAAPPLKPGEIFQMDPTAGPHFGCTRQGGCNEINPIVDPVMGPCAEFKVGDSDHTLPGTNQGTFPDGTPYPMGGCYPVHRQGGVSACLIAPVTIIHDQQWFIRVKAMIPSKQPGLTGGKWPGGKGRWFCLHEAYGAPMQGSPVTAIGLAQDAHGADYWVYGPGNTPHSFWTPLVLDQPADFIIGVTPSWDPKVGEASVTLNGVPLKSKAGNLVEHYQTEVPSDGGGGPSRPANWLCYLAQYRSNNYGGILRTLASDFRFGRTLASVQ